MNNNVPGLVIITFPERIPISTPSQRIVFIVRCMHLPCTTLLVLLILMMMMMMILYCIFDSFFLLPSSPLLSPCCISQGCKADTGRKERNTKDDVDMNKWSSMDDRDLVHYMYVRRHACNLKRIAICICCAADQRGWRRVRERRIKPTKGMLLQFFIFLHTYKPPFALQKKHRLSQILLLTTPLAKLVWTTTQYTPFWPWMAFFGWEKLCGPIQCTTLENPMLCMGVMIKKDRGVTTRVAINGVYMCQRSLFRDLLYYLLFPNMHILINVGSKRWWKENIAHKITCTDAKRS